MQGNEDEAFVDILILPEEGWEWVVVRTRPRCEKKLEKFCIDGSIPVYLPTRTRTHRYGNRRRMFASPLFSGYVFCRVDPAFREVLVQNRYCARLLRVTDQEVLVEQLRLVRLALDSDEVAEVMPYLVKGRRVRIASGPMKGAEGIVQYRKGKTRVVLNVDFIQQSVVMEVEAEDLNPA